MSSSIGKVLNNRGCRLIFLEKMFDLSPCPPPPTLALAFIRTPPLFINFLIFFWGNDFHYEIRNFKERATGGVLKKFSKLKESIRIFNTVYFSTRVTISFQHSIYQVIFLNLKNLFSHCFPLITILFVHRRFLIH